MAQRFPRQRPLPKAYTEPQLAFLKSYLPEFERRSLGPVRGDAKKFALDRAGEFIARFGIPEESSGDDDSDARFREQLYNWFKNTVGRNRRKAEGKPRSARKAAEKAAAEAERQRRGNPYHTEPRNYPSQSLSPTLTSDTYSQTQSSPAAPSPTVPAQAVRIPMQYSLPSTLANALQPSPSPPPPPPPPPPPLPHVPVTIASIRDAFLHTDAALLAAQIQAFVTSNPSPLPLKPVIFALFEAICNEWDTNMRPANSFLTRFLSAAAYFTSTLTHAGVSGPLAGARALQIQIRKSAKWVPLAAPNSRSGSSPSAPSSSSTPSSMSQELQRITLDRVRRKEHIHWARIHAAALEVGVFTFAYDSNADGGQQYDYATGRAFSELVVHDALWEDDEVEWVAGVLVLRALIRTAMRGDARQRRLWKEMRDEARQALVTEALLDAKADLARLDP
ncbi:hypothetical protein C8J57DRAFT_1555295 [Mycena rebaudengoi]|nr:hypothetical protein C8J57DRAFT_1555295 [Mycena rebaudengoi]